MSYDTVLSRLAALNRRLSLYDALVGAGIPKKDVHFYDTPSAYSG